MPVRMSLSRLSPIHGTPGRHAARKGILVNPVITQSHERTASFVRSREGRVGTSIVEVDEFYGLPSSEVAGSVNMPFAFWDGVAQPNDGTVVDEY